MNFTERCNMACPFCYIPFDARPMSLPVAQAVIDVVLAWNPVWLTFGGGDPLKYDWFDELVLHTHARRVGVTSLHLDTNGMRLSARRRTTLRPYFDLLGLPIDAMSKETSTAMRLHPTHAQRTRDLVVSSVAEGWVVKVNTVVSKINQHEVLDIGAAIEDDGAQTWSLYQFWPLGDGGAFNGERYQISDQRYEAIVGEAQVGASGLTIEHHGSVDSRHHAYFFVTPTGRAYTVRDDNREQYVELGNVLTDADGVLRRWLEHADTDRNVSRIARRRSSTAEAGMRKPV